VAIAIVALLKQLKHYRATNQFSVDFLWLQGAPMTLLFQNLSFRRENLIKTLLAIILQVGAVAFSSSISAETSVIAPIKNVYEVIAFGSPVGTIELVRGQKMAEDAFVNHQSVVIALDFEVGGKTYSFAVDSQIAHDDIGIRNYTHNVHENDEHFLITGRRVDGKLWLRTEQIHTKTQQENKALADVAGGIASQSIPFLGLLTGLLSTNSDESVLIPMDDFDVTEDELFDKLSNVKPGAGEQQYRVLNTETLELDVTTVTEPREDFVAVEGKDLRCLRVNIDSKNQTRTACIARDALGGYLIAESGSDKDGPYSIRLIQ
jgi:hypothetical protein